MFRRLQHSGEPFQATAGGQVAAHQRQQFGNPARLAQGAGQEAPPPARSRGVVGGNERRQDGIDFVDDHAHGVKADAVAKGDPGDGRALHVHGDRSGPSAEGVLFGWVRDRSVRFGDRPAVAMDAGGQKPGEGLAETGIRVMPGAFRAEDVGGQDEIAAAKARGERPGDPPAQEEVATVRGEDFGRFFGRPDVHAGPDQEEAGTEGNDAIAPELFRREGAGFEGKRGNNADRGHERGADQAPEATSSPATGFSRA